MMQNSIKNYAPVLISVFDRFDHFYECVESLKRASQADKTILYISSDGPLKTKDSIEKVKKIRSYAQNLTGFKSVHFFFADKNTQGKIKKEAHRYMLENHTFFIKTEDDNRFHKEALVYFNKMSEIHSDDESIYGVCGNCYPFVPKVESCFSLPYFNFWGVGIWSSKVLPMSFDKRKQAIDVLSDPEKFKRVLRYGTALTWQLRRIAYKELKEGDISYTVYMILNEKVCIYPEFSLIENFGNDGTGMNCKKKTRIKIIIDLLKIKISMYYFKKGNCLMALKIYFSSLFSLTYSLLTFLEHNSKNSFVRKFSFLSCELMDYIKR